MYVLTNEEMREADRYTIERLGVPSLTLMERAGIALADEAEKLALNGRILCVCGGGNNGGDGFVCARVLKGRGWDVEVLFYAEKISEDCRVNIEKWRACGGVTKAELPTEKYQLIVDCLYGTGFRGGLYGRDADVVSWINVQGESGTRVLSADIPSGICGENGLAENGAVKANVTLCIGEKKAGILMNDGLDFSGKIKRADIGIILPKDSASYARLITRETAKALLPARRRNSHKGTYGKAAVVAGSIQYTGAAYLSVSAAACLRAGAGYTTLFLPSELLPYYILKNPEVLLKSTNDGGMYAFNQEKMQDLLVYDSIAYGMGMGCSQEVANGAAYLLAHYKGKLILDADALNSLARYKKETLQTCFLQKKCSVLLTPHVKEFSRLSGDSIEEILQRGISAPCAFARKHQISVLLKSSVSVLTDGECVRLNATGNSGLAKGGSGDVLSGVIAGLCAQGVSVFNGGCLGAYLVGRAAELAAREKGEYALTATDVIEHLGAAFLELQGEIRQE
ncbi:MAG: NAD(P)H-hydrate dehydratase [Clostridia bacterium]|nr:NAD(P)H-hydrate dehydratase [Clostridia bacterium]